MNYVPPYTPIDRGRRVSCPDTFILTCLSRSDKHWRWQHTLTRKRQENVHCFWSRVIEGMWALALATPDAHILLQYVYGRVNPYEAERFDAYNNSEWVFLDAIKHCDDPEVRVEAAEHLANMRTHSSRYRALYARPS